ncbi:MAG TPA: DUF2478 domain-containing protein, partial [Rhodospirillales bacterium]|nr:DUF2478 domain-containing protein [Rhodospirillales bacterium]
IDISTGRRIAIKHAMKDDGECGLDVFALTETTGIIRDAIKDRPDLVVVEKFGAQEEKGEGLSDEILQTIAEGIPLLIAVPEKALPTWRRRSGGLGRVLSFNEDAFHEWWRGVSRR